MGVSQTRDVIPFTLGCQSGFLWGVFPVPGEALNPSENNCHSETQGPKLMAQIVTHPSGVLGCTKSRSRTVTLAVAW